MRARPFVCLIAGLTGLVQAGCAIAQAAGATGLARANVVRPVSAVALEDLDFGIIVAGMTGGRVEIAPMADLPDYTGAARPGCDRSAACPGAHPARFAVSGEAGRGYSISVPASLRIASSEGAAALLVDQIRVKTQSRPAAGPLGTLDSAGHDRFEVGATLHLDSARPSARYRGDVPVIVTYF